jgi:hypothetical protein
MKDPSPILRHIINLVLLALLLSSRIYERISHEFWGDEIEQIRNLLSVQFLLFKYLPENPGGLPGYYLLTLPLQHLAPYDKFVLGMPGLLAHLAVFALIPTLFRILGLAPTGSRFWPSAVAQAGFIINETLAYQSMEVRPYSVLPLLWACSIVLASWTIELLNNTPVGKPTWPGWKLTSILVVAHAVVLLWHAYGMFMLATAYGFFALTRWAEFWRALRRPVTLGIILSTSALVVPVWLHVHPGSRTWGPVNQVDTFSQIKPTIVSIGRSTLGNLSGRPDLNLGIVTPIVALGGLTLSAYRGLRNRPGMVTDLWPQICLYAVLVAAPIGMILVADIVTQYWFLQRQFIWTAVPFWMGIGVAANNLVSSLVSKISPGQRISVTG